MAEPLTWDVGLDADGDLPERCVHITGLPLILQRIRRRLTTVLGEYLVDRSVGLPFFDWFAQKPPDVEAIGALCRREIETCPGVVRVSEWTGSLDRDTRSLSFTAEVLTVDGDLSLVVYPLGEPGAGNTSSRLAPVVRSGRIAA